MFDPRDVPSVYGIIGNAGVQTPCPGSGTYPRSRKTTGSVQPTRCSQNPLLPDGSQPFPSLPRVPRVPSAPPAPAARFHTCSPRRAPSPSPAATPCESGYCRDHRSRAGVARQVPASAQALLQRWAGSGAGPRRGAGLALGRGLGRGWSPSGPLTPPGGRTVSARCLSSPSSRRVGAAHVELLSSSPQM